MNKYFTPILTCLIFLSVKNFAQGQDTTQHASFSYSGYVDAYWAIYSDSLGTDEYQKFATVSPRSNQFGLNVAMLNVKYSSKSIRGTFTLNYGDIPRSSWSPDYNYIQEANVGIKLCEKWWIDAGFFRTHIGTEALFPKENYTSSLAIGTYFEPLYQAGVKISYTPTEKLSLCFHVLNGYNLFEDNNRKKSVGLLVTYAFSDKLNIGYSGYYGDDTPQGDSEKHFRNYHNVFVNYKPGKFKLTAGVDIAMQQNSSLSEEDKAGFAMSGLVVGDYKVCDKFDVYARGEIFNDDDGILSGVFEDDNNEFTGLKSWGATLGVQYKPTENSYIKLEGRNLSADSDQKIFYHDKKFTNNRLEAMINMGFWFE
ncbi:MAG: outer membrane beta-barrel protein [Bacteroidia bacterium]